MNSYPKTRQSDLVVQNIANETLLYNLKTNKALCLNETSAQIWEMCDGNTDIPEIANMLAKKANKPVTEELVWLALDQLRKEGLLENPDKVNNDFGGLSRREVIRKVGFASMIALPIISAVVAPNAVDAQSGCATLVCGANCCPANNTCGSGNQCCPPQNCNSIPNGCPCSLNCSGCNGSVCNTITGFCQ